MSWSDDKEADGDVESDTAKRVTAMPRRVESESESGDEDPYYEKVIVPYNYQDVNDIDISELLIEHEEVINHLQEERIGHLAKISELKKEVMLLNSQLKNVLKQVRMMTTRTDVLDKMLEGQVKGKPNGIGFTHEHLKQEHQPRPAVSMVKKEWRPKCVGLITHTSLRASSSEDWYFDSGYSRQMTGVEKFLENVRPYAKSYVTFGDGVKEKIIGIGN